MRHEEDDISTLLKVIAACEVIGGGAALAKTVPDLGPLLRGTATPVALAGAGYFLALLVLSVVAGLLLWRMHGLGLPLSALVQALQVPYFFLPPWAYHMDLGLYYLVMLDLPSLFVSIAMRIGRFESVLGSGETRRTIIGINLFALGMLVALLRAMAHERQLRSLGPRERVALAWTTPVPMRTRVWRSAWRTLAVLAVLVGLPFLAAWLNKLV